MDEMDMRLCLHMANLAKTAMIMTMTTMNISLPEALKRFVDAQVSDGGYGTGSEDVRDLIRRDQDRRHLRHLLLDGASSTAVVDDAYFAALRIRARDSAK